LDYAWQAVSQPPWKGLVEELKDQGYESIYLDRLREGKLVADQSLLS